MSAAAVCRTVAACAAVLGMALTTATVALAAWPWLLPAALAPMVVAVGAEAMARLYEDRSI